MNGFVVLFTKAFLLRFVESPLVSYSYFSSLQNNLFQLNDGEMKRLRQMFTLLYKEKKDPATARHLLMAILEKGCTLQRKYHQIEHAVPEELNLVTRFRRLIDANFIENRTVEDINKVMTDYMNDVKKEADIYTHFTHNRSLFSQDFNKVGIPAFQFLGLHH